MPKFAEIYHVPQYAILRSIPNKLGGAIALAISIAILFTIPIKKSKFRGTQFYPINQVIFGTVTNTVILSQMKHQLDATLCRF